MTETTPQEALGANTETEYNFYAWLELPRFLDTRLVAMRETDGPIVFVDLCSSLPVYAELLRKRHYSVQFTAASKAVDASLQSYRTREQGQTVPGINEDDPGRRLAMHSFMKSPLLKRGAAVHQTITTAFSEILYDGLHEEEIAESKREDESTIECARRIIEEKVLSRIAEKDSYLSRRHGPDNIEDRWSLRFDETLLDQGSLIDQVARTVLVVDEIVDLENYLDKKLQPKEMLLQKRETKEQYGRDNAVRFINEIVRDITQSVDEVPRPYTVTSIDFESDTKKIKEYAEEQIDEGLKAMQIIQAAMKMRGHVVGDTLNLPIGRPESVTAYFSFEGWPFYFEPPRKKDFKFQRRIPATNETVEDIDYEAYNGAVEEYLEEQKRFLLQVFISLKEGGQFLTFPGRYHNQEPEDSVIHEQLLVFWKSLGGDVEIDIKSEQEIRHYSRGAMDSRLQDLSPVMDGRKLYHVLRLKKTDTAAKDWSSPHYLKDQIHRFIPGTNYEIWIEDQLS